MFIKTRLTAVSLGLLLASLALAASAGASMIGIYRNGMETTAQRSQLVKLSGRSCMRGGANAALRIAIGRRTKECSYRTPVIGRDLEIAATERLLSGTPRGLQRKVFLAVELRAGGGAKYQLAVYPLQRKVQLRKILSDGTIQYLAIVKNESAIKGINQANKLRLSAINGATGECRLLASVGGKPVADVVDTAAGDLSGRASGFSIGAASGATGTVASVDDIVVRVPSPF
jgi:hypothetical protein